MNKETNVANFSSPCLFCYATPYLMSCAVGVGDSPLNVVEAIGNGGIFHDVTLVDNIYTHTHTHTMTGIQEREEGKKRRRRIKEGSGRGGETIN